MLQRSYNVFGHGCLVQDVIHPQTERGRSANSRSTRRSFASLQIDFWVCFEVAVEPVA